eukprot:gene15585-biopygen6278
MCPEPPNNISGNRGNPNGRTGRTGRIPRNNRNSPRVVPAPGGRSGPSPVAQELGARAPPRVQAAAVRAAAAALAAARTELPGCSGTRRGSRNAPHPPAKRHRARRVPSAAPAVVEGAGHLGFQPQQRRAPGTFGLIGLVGRPVQPVAALQPVQVGQLVQLAALVDIKSFSYSYTSLGTRARRK